MATLHEDALQRVKETNAKLASLHGDAAATLSQLTVALSEYRRACTAAVHADYADACDRKIEFDLWDAHSRINGRFRKHMHALQRAGRKNAVEIRKENKLYLDFLKSSQKFYRNFICELDLYHGGISELRRVAHQLEPQQSRTALVALPAQDDVQKKLVMSCYNSLIHLGDLSRYRETECSHEAPKWGPAVGYYSLATDIYPDSGVSHNQLAMIDLADQNHVRTMHHLYRSVTVKEPHPSGLKNLEIEIRKILAAWEKGERSKSSRAHDPANPTRNLTSWFVRFHSQCYAGHEFQGHQELEDEVLGQLATAIKEHAIDTLLMKLVVINISAQWLAIGKIEGGDQSAQALNALYFYLRLNARSFSLLLEILLTELEVRATSTVGSTAALLSEELSPVTRRCLPVLRLYGAWLTENAATLSANLADQTVMSRVQDMWRIYASVMTKAAPLILETSAVKVTYMLEEDVDTIGFVPIYKNVTGNPWFDGQVLKPRFNDEGIVRQPQNAESLARLRDFVTAGIQLLQDKHLPLVYEDWRFTYRDDHRLSKDFLAGSKTLQAKVSVAAPAPATERSAAQSIHPRTENRSRSRSKRSRSAALNKDASLNRMVDALVGDDDSPDALPDDEDLPLTPPTHPMADSPMIRDLSNSVATLTTSDSTGPTQNLPFKHGPPGTTIKSLNATASPFVASFRESDPVRPHFESGWSSPHLQSVGQQPVSPQFRQQQPQTGWHSRGSSENTLLSGTFPRTLNSSPRPLSGSNLAPSLPTAFGDLHNVWGVSSTVPTAEWVRQRQPRYHEALTGPTTLGAGDGLWQSQQGPSDYSTPPTRSPTNAQPG